MDPRTRNSPPLKAQALDENPFDVPDDDEFINFRQHKKKEIGERNAQRQLPVWEKGVNKNREGALRRIDGIQLEPQAKNTKLTVAEAAQAALITDRVRARESVQKTIEKKREMFLLQMQIDIKKDEIKKIEQFSALRDHELKKAENNLDADTSEFNQFWDDEKKKSHEMMKEVKKLNKDKVEITHEINKLNEEIQQVNNQIAKFKENKKDYKRFKDFVNDAIPADSDATDLFDNPNLLLVTFDNYVEENLVLIQNIQDIEQELEIIRQYYKKNQLNLDRNLADKKAKKYELAKLLDEKYKKNNLLKNRLDKSKEEQAITGRMGELTDCIKRIIGPEAEDTQSGTLGLLEIVENTLDNYLTVFDWIDSFERGKRDKADPLYAEIKLALDKNFLDKKVNRRNEAREAAILEEKRKTELKSKKYVERSMHPVQKKIGRVAVNKVRIPEKRRETRIAEEPEEVKDWREFLEEV